MTQSPSEAPFFSGPPRVARTAAALLLVLGAACSADRPNAVRDSALDRDLTLAGSGTPPRPTNMKAVPTGDTAYASPSQPSRVGNAGTRPATNAPPAAAPRPTRVPTAPGEPAPAPAAPVPTAPTPAPASTVGTTPAPAAAPAMKTIPGGSSLLAQTTSQLCSLANRPGDKIVANLTHEVTGPDGAVLPVGTPVLIEMAVAAPPADFAFLVKGVLVNGNLVPVDGQVTSRGETNDRRVSKGGDKGKVATGAVIGAILGRVIGGGTKGTVIGAAGGAAAGSIAAVRNSVVEHCLPSGASITVTLAGPLVYPATSQ